MQMIKLNKKILLLILVVAVIAAVRFSSLSQVLTLENLKQERSHLLALVHDHYLLSVAAFIVLYILVTALSIPGAAVLTLAGGTACGTVLTTAYVNIGATAGATAAFLAARYLLGNRLQARYADQMNRFNEETRRNGPRYLLSLRLVPLFPFFLINVLAGLTRVSPGTFIWTTALGIIPGTLLFAYAGQQIGSINTPGEIFSPQVVLALAALAAVTLLPVLMNRIKLKRNDR